MAVPVLAAYDGHVHSAVRLGDQLARLLDLPLHVAVAYHYEPVSVTARQMAGSLNEARYLAAERALDRVLEALGTGPDVRRSTLPTERVSPGLLALAEELEAAALVVGPDERGNVAHELVREAHCPVVVAPADELLIPERPHAVGVAYDGSVGSRFALAAAHRVAIRSGAWLEILAVCTGDRSADPLHDEARAAAAKLEGVEVRCTFPHGRPAEELRHACEHLDLLACGSHGRGPLLGAVLGSVSARLIDDPPCPVLVVPAHARRDSAAPLGVTTARRT
ncbi:MAG: universal stress protein [Solirubrobacterales bacterium]|nr:universal stress protein [Solirubrobacterales bacterium]